MSFTMTVTPKAGQKILESMLEQTDAVGIRISVLPGGCSGFQYSMTIEVEINKDDAVIESEGVKLIVNKFSQLYLNNVSIDYTETLMGSGYTFNNPNSPNSCGCGSSFSV